MLRQQSIFILIGICVTITYFGTICRVNRLGTNLKRVIDDPDSETIFTHKDFGLIVDFKHLFNNIQNAITNFNDEKGGLAGYDAVDIEGLLEDAISRNKKRLENAESAYDAIKANGNVWVFIRLNRWWSTSDRL